MGNKRKPEFELSNIQFGGESNAAATTSTENSKGLLAIFSESLGAATSAMSEAIFGEKKLKKNELNHVSRTQKATPVISVLAALVLGVPTADAGVNSEPYILSANSSRTIDVPDINDRQNLVVNVAALGRGTGGFMTYYPCDDGVPRGASGEVNRSTINFNANGATSNLAIVETDDNGDLCVFTSADAVPVTDITDTIETGDYTDYRDDPRLNSGTLRANSSRTIDVPDINDRQNLVVNVAALGRGTGGFMTYYPCDDGVPRGASGEVNRSTINFNANGATSNLAIVETDDNGDLCVFTSADAVPVTDITDTIETGDYTDYRDDPRLNSGTLRANSSRTIDVPDINDRQNLVVNVAALGRGTGGFMTYYPCDDGVPRGASGEVNRSTINFNANGATSNLAIVETDDNGDLCVFTSADAVPVTDITDTIETGDYTDYRDDPRIQKRKESDIYEQGCQDGIYPEFYFDTINDTDMYANVTYYSNIFEPFEIPYIPYEILSEGFSTDDSFISSRFLREWEYSDGTTEFEWMNNGDLIEVVCNGAQLPAIEAPVIGLPDEAPRPPGYSG